jgi:hypothetical protein
VSPLIDQEKAALFTPVYEMVRPAVFCVGKSDIFHGIEKKPKLRKGSGI